MLNNLGLGFIFTARDQASATMARVGTAFDRQAARARMASRVMQVGMVAVGASTATMVSGLGLLRGAWDMAQSSAAFSQGISRVAGASNATAEELAQLRNRAIEAGIATQFTPDQAVEGLFNLATLGYTAQESMSALGGALDLAAGGAISVEEASGTLGAAMRVFSLDASEAASVTDRLLAISNSTALQASDLGLALGNISRGAGLAHQSLNEMLPAIGLVRNTGVEASVASSSVSAALTEMANNREAFQELGVSVTDAQGRFRPFLDIVMETQTALGTRYTSEAERASAATELFGRYGTTAFQGISTQLAAGIRDSTGAIRRNGEAVTMLRQQMENAAGAAGQFRDRMLNTFAGQNTLLRGSMATLAVVMGEPLARVFSPLVSLVVAFVNAWIMVFNTMPDAVKTGVATMIVAFGGLLTGGGAIATLGLLIALVIPFIETLAGVIGVLVAVMAPMIAGALAATAAFYGLFQLFQRNIGNIRAVWTDFVRQVSLGIDGLRMLFTRGGLTEAMDRSLDASPTLRKLIIWLYRIGHRVQQFTVGFRTGITEGFVRARPAINALVEAFRTLGRMLMGAAEPLGKLARTPSRGFRDMGDSIGRWVVRPLVVLIDVVRGVVQFFQGLLHYGRIAAAVLAPVWYDLVNAFRELGNALTTALGLAEQAGTAGRTGVSPWREFAMIVVPLIATGLRIALGWIIAFVHAITWCIQLFNELNAGWDRMMFVIQNPALIFVASWNWARGQFFNMLNAMIAGVNSLVQALPPFMRNGLGITTIPSIPTPQVVGQAQSQASRQAKATAPRAAEPAPTAMATISASPEARGGQNAMLQAAQAMQSQNAAFLGALRQRDQTEGNRPIQLIVDGEVLARATARAARGGAAAAGAPTPGFAED
jgi:TP901 family phage tail tape measure protein